MVDHLYGLLVLVPLDVGLLLSLLWVGSMVQLDCAWLRAWYEAMGTRFDCSVRSSDRTCAMLTRPRGHNHTAKGTQRGGRQDKIR